MSDDFLNKDEGAERLEGESGLSIEGTSSSDVYPNAEVRIIPAQYSVTHINRLCEIRKELIMDPDFQRNDVWKGTQREELVESILMGIPIPVIYLFESKDGRKQVIDGRQRISTIIDFLNNRFRLKNLKILKGLNGKCFEDLEPKLQGVFEDFQLSFYIIQPPTPERVKYDIFDRVNRGGTKLNSQEMRNALYQGISTRLIKKIADSDEFKTVTAKGVSPKRMRDRYVVLRGISFYLYYTEELKDPYNMSRLEYKSDIDDFLAKAMIYMNENLDEEKADKLYRKFTSAYRRIYMELGEDAFRFTSNILYGKRRPINMPLMEVVTLVFILLEDRNIGTRVVLDLNDLKNRLDISGICNSNVDSSKNWEVRINMIKDFIDQL